MTFIYIGNYMLLLASSIHHEGDCHGFLSINSNSGWALLSWYGLIYIFFFS